MPLCVKKWGQAQMFTQLVFQVPFSPISKDVTLNMPYTNDKSILKAQTFE